MGALPRQGFVIAAVLVAGLAASAGYYAAGAGNEPVAAGLWFDEVSFHASRLGGELTPADKQVIERLALDEVQRAFAGLRLSASAVRGGRYHVRVVQQVLDRRLHREWNVAGQSRAMAGVGGYGEVNFSFLAGSALAYADDTATRDELVSAIGRGVGRAAVHEFTHQLLPRAPIHRGSDRNSYEYYSAGRPEQYFGEMRWGLARPLLEARLGVTEPAAEPAAAALTNGSH